MNTVEMRIESELEIKVTGSIVPFQKGRQYMPNGDPGYPDEGGYCEDLTACLVRNVEVKQKDGSVKTQEIALDITEFVHNLDQLSCDLYEKHCEESDYYEAAMEDTNQ